MSAVENCAKIKTWNPRQGWQSPEPITGLPEYIGREVAPMTTYETIMVFLEMISLLISSSGLIIALLTFLDKRNKHK